MKTCSQSDENIKVCKSTHLLAPLSAHQILNPNSAQKLEPSYLSNLLVYDIDVNSMAEGCLLKKHPINTYITLSDTSKSSLYIHKKISQIYTLWTTILEAAGEESFRNLMKSHLLS